VTAAVCATPARAFEGGRTFAKGTVIFSLQAGGGEQNNVEGQPRISNLSFVTFTPRLSILPFDPVGRGWLHGALETGLEGWLRNGGGAEGGVPLSLPELGRARALP